MGEHAGGPCWGRVSASLGRGREHGWLVCGAAGVSRHDLVVVLCGRCCRCANALALTGRALALACRYHPSGLICRRQMWARMTQTVIFLEGDDSGAELNQAPVVIEGPDGALSHGTTTASPPSAPAATQPLAAAAPHAAPPDRLVARGHHCFKPSPGTEVRERGLLLPPGSEDVGDSASEDEVAEEGQG